MARSLLFSPSRRARWSVKGSRPIRGHPLRLATLAAALAVVTGVWPAVAGSSEFGPNQVVRTASRGTSLAAQDIVGRGDDVAVAGEEAATVPEVVKDINIGGDANPAWLTDVGGTVFFSATGRGGRELWKSDGTAEGTVRVRDIRPGPASSRPTKLTAVAGVLFFTADDGTRGRELWMSDGTAAGTRIVKDIHATGGSNPGPFLEFAGRVYFSANDGARGRELWRSDGTTAGTRRIKDVRPGPRGSDLRELTAVGRVFYFVADDVGTVQLWKSDGTSAGTTLVKDVGSSASDLTNAGGTLLFAGPPGFPAELWKSRGTAASTRQVGDVVCGWEGCHLTSVGDIAFLAAFDEEEAVELFRSDGTAAGTYRVQDINPTGSSWPQDMIEVGGRLLFRAVSFSRWGDLWFHSSDGTDEGTVFVSYIQSGGSPAADLIGDTFYLWAFTQYTGPGGIWRTNGTASGTEFLTELPSVGDITAAGGTLYFVLGDQLWRYTP